MKNQELQPHQVEHAKDYAHEDHSHHHESHGERSNLWGKIGGVAMQAFQPMQNLSDKIMGLSRTPDRPVLNRDGLLAWSNTALGPFEVVVSAVQHGGAAMLDGLHNITDGLAYISQLASIRSRAGQGSGSFLGSGMLNRFIGRQDQESEINRKNTYRLMAYPAVGALALSAYGIGDSLFGEKNHAEHLNYGHITTAGASLAIAGLLIATGRSMKQKLRPDASKELVKDVNDFHSHAKLDVVSSSFAIGEAALQTAGTVGSVSGHLLGVGISAAVIKKFWPSEKNLHRGLEPETEGQHAHSNHGDCDHEHLHLSDIFTPKLARAMKIGATALGIKQKAEPNGDHSHHHDHSDEKVGWRQKRKELKALRKQAYRESAWWNWLEATSGQPNNPLANWAKRELEEKPDFPPLKYGFLRNLHQKMLKG